MRGEFPCQTGALTCDMKPPWSFSAATGELLANGKPQYANLRKAIDTPINRLQGQLFVHRAHQGYVSERTALINRIRGLLSELGIVLPQAFKAFLSGVAQVLEDLPGYCNQVIGDHS